MKILKPETLALLYRHFRLGAGKHLSLGMMGLFSYADSRRDALLTEPQLWAAVGEAIGKDGVLDEGLPKSTGEFLVYGAAHAPTAAPVPELPVSARVGAVKKTLYVFGDRRFTALGGISDPVPFQRMPLGLAQSFGGAGHPLNPAGKGLHQAAGADGALVTPLPNVEAPDGLMLAEDDRPAPAGFWPLPATAAPRREQLGAFDDAWLKNHWPHLPPDTRAGYFQAARPDQRIAGFFKGDEAIEIMHMNPQRPLQNGSLPKLRARCFVNRKLAAGGEQFAEITARAETVWLLPEIDCGIVLYRAVVDVADEQADDVLHVMAEWENLGDAPLPFGHYERLFRERLAAPVEAVEAPAAAVAAAPAAPTAPAVPTASVAVPAATAPPGVAELEKLSASIDADIAALMKRNGVKTQDVAPYMKPLAESPQLTLPELEKLSASINADIRALMAKNKVTDADVAKYMAPAPSAAPMGIAEMKATMLQVERQTASLMEKNGITHADLQKFAASRPELAHMAPDLAAPTTPVAQLFAAFPAAAAPLLTAPPMPAAPPLPPPPQATAAVPIDRDYVIARHARREKFAGLDLSGLDLSGLDLAGADFADAVLEKTNFAKSRLAGADFGRALLKDADFSGADLAKAGLAGVSAGGATFAGARMEGSDASAGDFSGADFSAAKLAGANLSGSAFDGAKMAGLGAAGCRADKASFNNCDLRGADFGNANLAGASFSQACLEDAQLGGTRCEKAEFYGTRAARANFAEANLKGSRADQGTQFADARFSGAHLGRANWEGARIEKALFDKAVLDDADFSRAGGAGAQFAGASAKGAKFDKADLANADFTRVNLFKGSLRAAQLETTALKFANLYGADFYGTTTKAANTEGSVIDNTSLPVRRTAT